MTRRGTKLAHNDDGAAAIEAAIALPVLVTMIYGIFSLGQLFEANAGMQHALGEGARYGTLCVAMTSSGCTLPTDTQISTRVTDKLFGTTNGTFDTPVVDSTAATTGGYKTITVTYHQSMKFAFFTGPTIDITRSKRVYLASGT